MNTFQSNLGRATAVFLGSALLLYVENATAQPQPEVPAAPAASPTPAATPTAEAAVPEAPAPHAVEEAERVEPPAVAEPTPDVAAVSEPTPVPEPELEAVEPQPALVDEEPEFISAEFAEPSAFQLFMFADANYAFTTSHRDSISPPHREFAGNAANGTTGNGFALEWVGVDLAYDGGEVGVRASLRFGDAVPTFFGDQSPNGIANLAQGYVSWAPLDRLVLDLGQFYTPFGVEASESWLNLNYTRGALYLLTQPLWHTGLKGSYAISDVFGVTAMVVNGVNTSFDEDDAPSAGLQLALTPGDKVQLFFGGMQTFDSDADSSGFDTFFDVAALLRFGDLTGILNAKFNVTRDGRLDDAGDPANGSFFGLSAALGYAFTQQFGVAARYELLSDHDDMLYGVNAENGTTLHTITGTIDLKPLWERDNLVVRWDNRIETASEDVFRDQQDRATNFWFASVLGVVVKMDE